MRLELERFAAIELGDIHPAEQRGLALVPPERRSPVRDARRDEHGGPESVFGEHGEGMLGHVEIAVVEVQPNGALRRFAGLQQIGDLDDVENLVSG